MSSLSSAMSIAVSALKSQASSVSAISNNLANSETIGYKTTDASFYSLVTGTSSNYNFTGAGVVANPRQNIAAQGAIVGTESTTDLAIDGNGFFVVTDDAGGDVFYYTRAGNFFADDDGNLVNRNGYYLQGYPTDNEGNVTTSAGTSSAGLETVNIERVSGSAIATTELSVSANLPADLAVGGTVEADVEIYDSLGVAHTVTITYEKTGANTWDMYIADPVLSSDGGTVSGTASSPTSASPVTLTFSADDGSLLSTSSDPITFDITGWSSGAADSSITYDPGTVGTTSGLSQWSSGADDPADADIDLGTIRQNGVRYGSFYSATIDEDGYVYANFSNGVSYPIYQIPLATFSNANGLEAVSGNAYSSTVDSGNATYVAAGSGGSGTIFSGSLERSTTDTADQFSKLITAQQAYSAASEIISSSQDMFDSLISAKR
ncbi:flagellar hook protein FlgE [Roseospirillum parvum]|uniref:Flagellar hook protein FlgE n=1 Tax=Roseospirillum parvum TaxID=83401 RepID=A0A1G8AND7_9PROT|nr:flagellar hook protein FlgE [Roseospirillum parvum]SDH22501.1 flagellar hook protein FlgE [Roseospirillum parvum]